MKDERIRNLIAKIDAGQFSRNKHFEAYKESEVREARARQLRLRSLIDRLGEFHTTEHKLTVQRKENHWLLSLSSSKLRFSWSASLQPYELEFLREDGVIRDLLDTHTVEEALTH